MHVNHYVVFLRGDLRKTEPAAPRLRHLKSGYEEPGNDSKRRLVCLKS